MADAVSPLRSPVLIYCVLRVHFEGAPKPPTQAFVQYDEGHFNVGRLLLRLV